MTQQYPPQPPPYGHPGAPAYGYPAAPPPAPKRKRRWPWVVGALFVFFVLVPAIGNAGRSTPASPTSPASTSTSTLAPPAPASPQRALAAPAPAPDVTPEVVKATTIGNDYERNKVAAAQKWGGKFVQFTATVGNITDTSVSFTDVTSKQFSLTQIACYLDDPSQAVSLAKGEKSTVQGVIDGDQLLGVISMNECRVV